MPGVNNDCFTLFVNKNPVLFVKLEECMIKHVFLN